MERKVIEAIRRLSRANASPVFWRSALECQRNRLEDALERQVAISRMGAYSRELNDQMRWDVHFLLVAVRHVLRLMDEYLRLTQDERLMAAANDFKSKFTSAVEMRDILEHFNEYAQNRGRRQVKAGLDTTRGAPPPVLTTAGDNFASLGLLVESHEINVIALCDESVRVATLLWQISEEIRGGSNAATP